MTADRTAGREVERHRSRRRIALALLASAVVLPPVACGSDATTAGSPPDGLDRSDPAAVQVAMITALLEYDIDTVRLLVLPDQRDLVDPLEQAAALADQPDIEIVSLDATVVEESEDTAVVDDSGSYCLPASTTEVPVTTLRQGAEAVEVDPVRSVVVEEPERCFDLDELFGTEGVELRRIDGAWYAPLPA